MPWGCVLMARIALCSLHTFGENNEYECSDRQSRSSGAAHILLEERRRSGAALGLRGIDLK